MTRRLLAATRGGGGFPALPFTVSGPYDPALAVDEAVLTQLHCHTTQSDGTYSPAQIVDDYLSAGYGALQITDHDTVTSQPAGITTAISGNETSPTQQHILAMNSVYTRGATTDAQTIIDGIVAGGGEAAIAHPLWTAGMPYAEQAALTDYLGMEIHNSAVVQGAGQDPVAFPGYALARWDQILTNVSRSVRALSVDDYHAAGPYTVHDIGRVIVFVETNDVASIMSRLASGNFVADVSNHGVTPGFPLRSRQAVSVTCPGATRIEAWGSTGLLAATDGSSFAYGFDGSEYYVRLVAIGDYTEPFASLSDRWAAVDGTWAVSGGSLNVTSDGTARRIICRRDREGDFQAEADVEISGIGGDAIALMFNALNDDNYYMLRIGESVVSGYNNELAVAYTTDGLFANDSQLDNFTFDPVPGTVYTLKVDYTASTGRIQAKVWETGTSEPAFQIDVSDTTWTHGKFGFRANRSCKVHRLYINGFQTFYQPIAID